MASTVLKYSADESIFSAFVFGAVIGDLALVGAAYGVAYLIARPPTRRRRATITAVVVLAVMLVSSCAALLSRLPASSGLLTDAERAGLEVTPAGIRHPALGFNAPHPGEAFVLDTGAPAKALDSVTAVQRGKIQSWAFSEPGAPGLALLQLMVGPRMDERSFRSFANGMGSRMRDPAVAEVLADTVIWTPERKEFRMTIRHAQTDMFLIWRCLPSAPAPARPYVICAMSSAMDTTGLSGFTEGLSVTQTRR
jgi:hypothetical protein